MERLIMKFLQQIMQELLYTNFLIFLDSLNMAA